MKVPPQKFYLFFKNILYLKRPNLLIKIKILFPDDIDEYAMPADLLSFPVSRFGKV